MTSSAAVRLGAQRPRVLLRPPAPTSAGAEAAELASSAGLDLDDWQRFCLDVALGERADGRWAAFEVGLDVPRQNGKGGVLEAIELAHLFLFDQELILHTAHQHKTAREAFRRMRRILMETPELADQVLHVRRSNEETGFELRSGQRLLYIARKGGSGRGFTGDVLVFDEAMDLDTETVGDTLPTLSARPNPQVYYAGSAPLATSAQFHAVRNRGILGRSSRLAWLEWSVDEDLADQVLANPDDTELMLDAAAQANPGLGIRVTEEFLIAERDATDPAVWRRERLGVPDPAPSDGNGWEVIAEDDWGRVADPATALDTPTAFAVEVTPGGKATAIAVAGLRPDPADPDRLVVHLEIVEKRPGTAWALDRLAEIRTRWGRPIGLDPAGPAGALIPDLEERGIEPVTVTAREFAQACGAFTIDVVEGRLAHRDQAELNAAVVIARSRPLGASWAWDRKAGDVAALVAVTIARHVARTYVEPEAKSGPVFAW